VSRDKAVVGDTAHDGRVKVVEDAAAAVEDIRPFAG
jgi:hypothetical protein